MNYVLGGVLVAAAAFMFTRAGALGVLVGVVLSCVNFSVMRRMLQGWMRRSSGLPRSTHSFVMVPKMALLMLAVVLALYFLPIKAEGLAIGFSIFLVSIAVEAVRYFSNPPLSDDAGVDDAKQ